MYISDVSRTRSVWSRWTVLLLALVASLASPGLAVAHGMAHAHGAEAHRVETHHAEVQDSGHDPHGRFEHHHSHEHGGQHDHEAPAVVPSEGGVATLTGPEHGHQHHHARVESVPAGRGDTRDGLDAPVISAPTAVVLPLATHALPPLTRWDTVSLARPAPDTGPPPTLRAPPTC